MINGPPSLKSYGATRRWHHAPSVLQPVSCILSVGRFLGAFHPGFNHQAQSISKKSLDLQFCTQNGMLKTKKCPFLKLYLQIFRHLAWLDLRFPTLPIRVHSVVLLRFVFLYSSIERCAVSSSSTQSSSSHTIPLRPGTLRVGPALYKAHDFGP